MHMCIINPKKLLSQQTSFEPHTGVWGGGLSRPSRRCRCRPSRRCRRRHWPRRR